MTGGTRASERESERGSTDSGLGRKWAAGCFSAWAVWLPRSAFTFFCSFLFYFSYLFQILFKTDSKPFKLVSNFFKSSRHYFKIVRKHFS
jgi:hypothetical protein